MKNVESVIKNRNILKEAIVKIQLRIKEEQNDRQWDILSREERIIIGSLYGLKNHYEDQAKALNYVLNEDSKLDDFKWNPHYQEFKDLLVNFY